MNNSSLTTRHSALVNALTVDVEDYFQVEAFSDIVRFENWDQYESRVEHNTHRLLDLFSEAITHTFREPHTEGRKPSSGVHATFFILGWLADRFPALVKRIQAEGHEVACHGYAHKLIYQQSREAFREEVRKSKEILEALTGEAVIGYRAPSYSITEKSLWALEILREEGFRYDSSIFPIHHDFYGIPTAPRFPFLISSRADGEPEFIPLNLKPRAANPEPCPSDPRPQTSNQVPHAVNQALSSPLNPQPSTLPNSRSITNNSLTNTPVTNNPITNYLIEFPITTYRFLGQNLPIAGGGYFRLFPYGLTKRALRAINEKENQPFIFYIHPWEIDPDQPRMKNAGVRSRFRHYLNLQKTESRLKSLLSDFPLDTMLNVLNVSRHESDRRVE